MDKIFFIKESKEIRKINKEVQEKLNSVEHEDQLSLEDIKELREVVADLLDTIDDEVSSWE